MLKLFWKPMYICFLCFSLGPTKENSIMRYFQICYLFYVYFQQQFNGKNLSGNIQGNFIIHLILLLQNMLCFPVVNSWHILNAKCFTPESAHAEMGSISDAEHELQLVEEKIHDAQQVWFSYPHKYLFVCSSFPWALGIHFIHILTKFSQMHILTKS